MTPILPLSAARVFYDGLFTAPRLQHPECVAVAPDGAVWCGTENGEVMRIAPDGSGMECVASTGGFVLGIAFDGAGHLLACDLRHACVFRLHLATGVLERFTPPGVRVPNYPVVDRARGCLWVSDSVGHGTPGPGVWRYDLRTGQGAVWWTQPMRFANGMALAPDGASLLVAETEARRIVRLHIGRDGAPARMEAVAEDLPGWPDGVALDDAGRVYVACYEPSRILRLEGGAARVLIEDPFAHLFCHPTNIAFRGGTLFSANLGCWHVTVVECDAAGPALPL